MPKALSMLKLADEDVAALEPLVKTDDDRRWASEWRDKLHSNTAWIFLLLHRFGDAKTILAEEVAKLPSLPAGICNANESSDRERGHMYQNLADAELGLGDAQAAVEDASVALECSIELGTANEVRPVRERPPAKEWLDAAKTKGVALIEVGRKQDGQALLMQYLSRLTAELDDNDPPEDHFRAYFSGSPLDIRSLLEERRPHVQ
jgi:hypothetical protein